MGYRSDVTLVFYTSNKEELPFSALRLWFAENYPRLVAIDEWDAEISSDEAHYIMVTYQAVKWYPDYDHVKAVQAAIGRFNETFDTENKQNASWEMMEVGEELNDITHTYSPWCDFKLYMERNIRMDW